MPGETKVLTKIYPDEHWFSVAVFVEGKGWEDGVEQFDTRREARNHMCKLNFLGNLVALVKHTTSAHILATNDFRNG